MGSIEAHREQYKLNLLDKEIFRLLGDEGIPLEEEALSVREKSVVSSTAQMVTESENKLHNTKISENPSPEAVGATCGKIVEGKTLCSIILRPTQTVDM